MRKTFVAASLSALSLGGGALAALTLGVPAALASEAAAPEAEADANVAEAITFAKDLTDKATAALTSSKPRAEQIADFQAVLSDGLALDLIGKFMIADIRKTMTPEQVARFDAAFPPYLTRLYADQFAPIVGRPLTIIGAKPFGASDAIVRTQFVRSEGPAINVDWRIRKLRSGERKAVDIIVGGVSIMMVKRAEFSAFITQNNIDALLDRIEAEGKA